MKKALSRKNLWEGMPPKLRSIVGRSLQLIPLEFLLGARYRSIRRQIKVSESWSIEQRTAFSAIQLQRICQQAYAKSEYYREVFDAVKLDPSLPSFVDRFHELPFIDKSIINTERKRLAIRDLNDPSVDYVTTGGTSGVQLKFYIGRERSSIEYAHLVSGWMRAGFHLGDRKAVLRGRVIERADSNGIYKEDDPLLRETYLSNFHMNPEQMRAYVDEIAKLGRCFLHVYPSSVYMLARFIRSSGMKAPDNIVGILAESENVYPEQREFVESVFNCRYYSSYGHSEKLVSAAECALCHDYHIYPTYGYCELIDEDGKPVQETGVRGEIVGTGYINDVMPFIRFRTGDYAEYVGEECADCGLKFQTIRNISGHRTQEYIVAQDRRMIPWSAINMHDDTFDRVRQYQFRQDEIGRVTALLVVDDGYSSGDEQKILENMQRKLGGDVEVTIQKVDSIALTQRGKAVFVDQRLALDF